MASGVERAGRRKLISLPHGVCNIGVPMASADIRTDFLPRIAAWRSLFIALVALWLLLLGMETIRPGYFLHDDNASWFIGAYLHDYRVVTETGRLAEVNYFQHGGEPFVEQGQTAVLYPPVYLGVALARVCSADARSAIEWIAALHLTLGLLGFYFWARQCGVAARFAALGALAWVLNPFVLIVGVSWIFVTFVAAWLPWLFWALDRLMLRPSASAALLLGLITSLLFLQGYVQYFAYALVFLILYALIQFVSRPQTRRLAVVYYMVASAFVAVILGLPLLLPMIHALGISATRPTAFLAYDALYYSVTLTDIAPAQVGLFHPAFAFDSSSAILFCPALLFLPVAVAALYFGGGEARRWLIPLIVLAVIALIFSTSGHWILNQFPVFDKFRWPFKVFLFANFFLTALLVRISASWTDSRPSPSPRSNLTASACLILVMFANLGISLAFHDDNAFSPQDLPVSMSPLLPAMDPRLGRVVAFADNLPETLGERYLSRAYATYFAFPSLGGYNPLVGQKQLEYAYYLDYPNVCTGTLTPDFQQRFEARSVRYWMVDPQSSQFKAAQSLPGLKVLQSTADRVVFEDTQAAPLAYAVASPGVPLPLTYSGNSLMIEVGGVASPVAISVAPTDGWWYRLDRGAWLKAVDRDHDFRLIIPFQKTDRQLEITYFDPRFRLGLTWSAGLLPALALMFVLGRRLGW